MHQEARRSILTAVLVLILIAALILGALWYFDIPRTWQAYSLFHDMWSRHSNAFDMVLTVDTGDAPLEISGGFSWVDHEKTRVFRLGLDGAELYVRNNILCFANGRAYTLTDAIENFTIPTDFLSFLGGMTISGNRSDGFTVATLDSDSAQLRMELRQSGSITATVNAQIDGAPVQVQLLLEPTGTNPEPIPETVMTALQNGAENAEPLTTSLLRLWAAWAQLSEAETVGADVTWSVRGGVIQLSDAFTFFRTNGPDGPVCSVGKDSFTAFNPEMPQSDIQNAAASLPGILYAVLSCGDTSCTVEGGRYIYALDLDAKSMEQICYTLAPDAQEMWITFHEGRMELTLEGSQLAQVSIQCSGEIEALIVSIPVSLNLEAAMLEDPVFPE